MRSPHPVSSPGARRRARAGNTLFQVAVLISLVGVVLAVFVPTFFRHVNTSKISEASEQLAELHRRTAAYYATARSGEGAQVTRWCLPPAAGPTPDAPVGEGVEVDFTAEATPGSPTWSALGFAPEGPLRYSYAFFPAAVGCGLEGEPGRALVTYVAEGDLDGDGQRSRFERNATVSDDGQLVPLGVLLVADRIE